MRWSIHAQLLLPLLILLLSSTGISTWTGIASARSARRQIERDMRNVAQHLSEAPYTLNRWMLPYLKRLSGADFILVDAQAVVPGEDVPLPTTLPAIPDELPPAEHIVDDWEELRLSPPLQIAGETYLCSGVRLRSGSTVYVLYPERLWRDALWAAIRPSLVLGIVPALVSLVLAVLVSARLGRRIQALVRRTRLIAAGDFSPMPLPRRHDELRDLSESVNQMAAQLTVLQETVKQTERLRLLAQVSGGLAHQLRNGVTGARLAVQLHARACRDQAEADALVVALRQLDLVEANLKRFLNLGHTEVRYREACQLPALIDEVIALLQPQCRHAHTELRWQRPAGNDTVSGDASQLRHLFLNVIGNAIEAAGPHGWVAVTYRRAAETPLASIEISDSGPGPPPEVAARLFQPFVTGKREGVGLGLAVARQAAEAHGGSIAWRRAVDHTCFRIEIPLTDI